jgi:hypothetical protein
MAKIKYVDGWIACIKRKNNTRFPNVRSYLYSEPFSCETYAQKWTDSFDGCECLRIEKNTVPQARIVM